MIQTKKITLKKLITLFFIVVVSLHISSYTDCMTMPRPAVPAPLDEPPPVEQAAQPPAKPAEQKPVEQAAQPPAKPAEQKPVEQAAQPPVKPAEPKPVEQPVQPPVKPAEPKPVEQVVQPPVKPAEPQPIEQAAQAPTEPEKPQPVEEVAAAPEEPQPVEEVAAAPEEPEEPQPVEEVVAAPEEPEEPQPVEQAAQAPAEPEKPQPDMSLPEVSVQITPQPYCPINPDGEEQLLTANIHVKSASPIDTWYIELRNPESDEIFLSMAQKGEVPKTLIWNGRNSKNELVESATLYLYSLTVTNAYGSTTCLGALSIDIVVIKEGNNLLRIIVPSIIFAPNTVQLTKGLDPATSASNDRILKRIAEILNYFGTYKVRVEGHANPTFAPDSAQRASEERGTREILGLQPVSEQRAKAVVEYLVKLGINRSRLTPVGMGGRGVRADFDDKPNWWKNRRVEFVLEKP